jgi:diguanylate cyclase (GGDEF)-like protein/PAS domain S-box-containing protein
MNDQMLMHHHDLWLVVLSILAAMVAGYAALDLAQRAMRAERDAQRRRLLLLAAVTMAVGIWTMHFLGMLSLDLGVHLSYAPLLLGGSIVPALLGAAVALEVVTKPQAGWPSVLLGAAFMGLAVAAMHYMGMAALRLPARVEWNPWLVALSLAIAYGASLLALTLVHNLHAGQRWRRGPLLAAAAAFGVAVAGLHYVGMFAATFYAEPGSTEVSNGGAGTDLLAILLAGGTLLMLIVLLFGASIDRQRGAFGRDLGVVARMMRDVVRGDDARASICRAALDLGQATTASILEPDAKGRLISTSLAGDRANEPDAELARATYESGARRFEPGRDRQVATLYEPVLLDGNVVGVLFFVWRNNLRTLSERSIMIAGLLAAEASFAIDRADMVRRLELQARTDELTGLPNRRTVTAELGRRLDAGGALAVAMLDLDRFKEFNDRYGHQGGDRLLEAAAVAWSAQLGDDDMVGRYGGEEFLAILPGCDQPEAVALADRLRAVLPLGVTCSAGVAAWDGEESPERLVARADAALYAAKSNGRDRTEAAPETRAGRARAPRESEEKPAADPIGRFLTAEGMRAFLDGIPAPFVILDLDGVIQDWNTTAAATFGVAGEDAIGRGLADLLDSPTIARVLTAAVEDGSRHGGPTPARPSRSDGKKLDAEVEWFLADVGDGDRLAVFIRDVGRRNARDRRLRRFEDIVAYSDDAVISGSAEGVIETWNSGAERLYGYSADEVIGEDIGILRPEGEDAGADPARRRAILGGRSVSMEMREQRRDGSFVDVAATIAPLRDEEGEVSGFVVIARDVTEFKGAAAKLAQADAQFAGAFEAAAIGMTLTATDGRFIAVNPAFAALLKRDREELIRTTFQELTHPDDLETDLVQFRRVLAGEIDSYQMPKRYLLPDGGILWGLLTVSVVRDGDGEPLHFVSQVQDIAHRVTAEGELRRYAEHLDALAAEDPLTGLRSAGGLMAALAEELSVQVAGGRGPSLVTIAVEGGDSQVLAAADSLRDVARGEDLAARLGESELAVLLPGVGEADAAAVVTRLRGALAGRSASFGGATARHGDDAGSLLARAREGREAEPDVECVTAPARIEALLELVRRQLGTPVSFLTRIENDEYVIERIAGERERFGIEEGLEMPLDGSHCARMLDGRIGSAVADLAELDETRDLDVTTNLGLRAYAGVPVHLRSGELFGTLCVVDTVPHPELSERQVDLLRFISRLAGEEIDRSAAEEEERVAETSAVGVRALLVALEARDKYTGEHSREVVRLASRVAERLGLTGRAVRDVEQVALLHDVGKVGIPDAILQKQGPLDDVEWEVMRKHPVVGERIIAGIPGLSHLAPAMRGEHERWDGGGYPDGLAGDAIPIASRITLACDAFHAMTSERPYRPAMDVAEASTELRRNAGTQFDPAVIDALLAELEKTGADARAEGGFAVSR